MAGKRVGAVEVYFDDFKVTQTKSPVVATNDYYAFGLTFNSYSRENSTPNQFKFNGKEEQDELGIGWLDYGARMYDPAIARWNGVDGMSEKYLGFSPYHFSANNPIRFYDVDGNYFTGACDEVDKVRNDATQRRDEATLRIGRNIKGLIEAVMKGDFKGAESAAGTINDLANKRDGFQATIDEISKLDNSSQEYHVSLTNGSSGSTSWNLSTNALDIKVNGNVELNAHELKHAYQFEMGTTSFTADQSRIMNSPFLYDLGDEVESYKRQALFYRMTLPKELYKGITESNIASIPGLNYSKFPTIQKHQIPSFPAGTSIQTIEGAYKNIAKNLNVAFRIGNKTYHP